VYGITKSVKINSLNKEVLVFDLTQGFVYDLEQGIQEDTPENVLLDATELTLEEIRKLRKSEVAGLVKEVLMLTYPDAYDEEGNLKEFDLSQEDLNDKKKV